MKRAADYPVCGPFHCKGGLYGHSNERAKSPAVEPSEQGYQLTIGRDTIRVVSVFSGTRTASEAIHEAAVKKILYDTSS